MSMSSQRQFLLGMFFLVALSILAFYTLFLTDISIFGDETRMLVYLSNAGGLREGDSVLVSGLRYGRVKSLELLPDQPLERRIEAVLYLNRPIQLTLGATIHVTGSTLLGGHHVEISPGEPGAAEFPPPFDGHYMGELEKNPIESLGEVGTFVSRNSARAESILANFDAISSDVMALSASTRAGEGIVGKLLVDKDLAEKGAQVITNLQDVSDRISRVTAEVEAGTGLLGQFVRDQGLATTVKETVESLKTIVSDVENGKGILGKALRDEELATAAKDAVLKISDFAQRLSASEGLLNKLLNDPAFAKDATDVITNVKSASEDVQAIVAHVRRGEGSLGKAFMQEDLYDELLKSVQLLTRSLEDYREAAPISIFTSALFGAF